MITPLSYDLDVAVYKCSCLMMERITVNKYYKYVTFFMKTFSVITVHYDSLASYLCNCYHYCHNKAIKCKSTAPSAHAVISLLC